MKIGEIKKTYSLSSKSDDVIDKIRDKLIEKKVNEIEIKDNAIYFKNDFISLDTNKLRSNWSLMAYIDIGYFKIIEVENTTELEVMFSIKRMIIICIFVASLMLIASYKNILLAFLLELYIYSIIPIAIIRYKRFIRKTLTEISTTSNAQD